MNLSVYVGAHVPTCAPTSASDKNQGIQCSKFSDAVQDDVLSFYE